MMGELVVENVIALPTGLRRKRAIAVEYLPHTHLCDGEHLAIETAGWLVCPRTGCGWRMDPEFPKCPVHGATAHD